MLASGSEAESARNREALEKERKQIEDAVESIVDNNFVGFNNSVKAFSTIFSEYHEAQQATTKLKDHLADTQRTLLHRKRNLKDLEFQKTFGGQSRRENWSSHVR